MIVNAEKHKESTEKPLLKLISKFSKGYKINIQTLTIFVYTSNKH